MNQKFDYLIKVISLGNYYSGKASLILRFVKDIFYNPISKDDFYIKCLDINNKLIRVNIWTVFCSNKISKNYNYKSHGAIIVYDITNLNSFDKAKYWIEQLKNNTKIENRFILVGTKCDDESNRKVKVEEGKKLADEYGIKFFECSAKNNINVNEMFNSLLNDIVENLENEKYSTIKLRNKKDNLSYNKCAQ